MNKKLVLALLLLAVSFSLGCIQQQEQPISNQEQVSKVITNISEGTEKIGSILQDLDNELK